MKARDRVNLHELRVVPPEARFDPYFDRALPKVFCEHHLIAYVAGGGYDAIETDPRSCPLCHPTGAVA